MCNYDGAGSADNPHSVVFVKLSAFCTNVV